MLAADNSDPLAKYKELTPIQQHHNNNHNHTNNHHHLPQEHVPTSGVLKHGFISLKEEGLKAFIWSKRYMALREFKLSFHRNEVSRSYLCQLALSSKLLALQFFISVLARR
jgi:protein-serine/threonine kinase